MKTWYIRRGVEVCPGGEETLLALRLVSTGSRAWVQEWTDLGYEEMPGMEWNGEKIYLRGIGHSFYDRQVEFRLECDGEVWMKWDYQLGGVSPQDRYDFPTMPIVEKSVKLVVTNKTSTEKYYEGMLDGFFGKETVEISNLQKRMGTVEKLLEGEWG